MTNTNLSEQEQQEFADSLGEAMGSQGEVIMSYSGTIIALGDICYAAMELEHGTVPNLQGDIKPVPESGLDVFIEMELAESPDTAFLSLTTRAKEALSRTDLSSNGTSEYDAKVNLIYKRR